MKNIYKKYKEHPNKLRPDKEFPSDMFQSSHQVFKELIIPESARIAQKEIQISTIRYTGKFTLAIKIVN